MADKNESYTKTPIRLIQCLGYSSTGVASHMVIIYEKDGFAGDIYIPLNRNSNEHHLRIPNVRFVDDESVIVWKTTVETGILSGRKQKTELFEVLINRNFQIKA